jgi:hypothetical protein
MRDSRADEAQIVSYDPAKGYATGVHELTVAPASLKAGEPLTVIATYWALAPDAAETFGMYRYAGLALDDLYVKGFNFNPEPFNFTEGGGEYRTTMTIYVPPNVSPGTYTVQWSSKVSRPQATSKSRSRSLADRSGATDDSW